MNKFLLVFKKQRISLARKKPKMNERSSNKSTNNKTALMKSKRHSIYEQSCNKHHQQTYKLIYSLSEFRKPVFNVVQKILQHKSNNLNIQGKPYQSCWDFYQDEENQQKIQLQSNHKRRNYQVEKKKRKYQYLFDQNNSNVIMNKSNQNRHTKLSVFEGTYFNNNNQSIERKQILINSNNPQNVRRKEQQQNATRHGKNKLIQRFEDEHKRIDNTKITKMIERRRAGRDDIDRINLKLDEYISTHISKQVLVK